MHPKLSKEAFRELKEIAHKDYGNSMPDSEIEEMGERLLRLFSLLSPGKQDSQRGIELTDQESMVLEYIQKEMESQRHPSARSISKLLGFRSSRSGFRFLNGLIERGLLVRNEKGKLSLTWELKKLP